MLRKVIAGSPWTGPNDLAASRFTRPTARMQLILIMQLLPVQQGQSLISVMSGATGWQRFRPLLMKAAATYGCGACHTAGFKDNTNPGVQSIGTPGYTPAQPARFRRRVRCCCYSRPQMGPRRHSCAQGAIMQPFRLYHRRRLPHPPSRQRIELAGGMGKSGSRRRQKQPLLRLPPVHSQELAGPGRSSNRHHPV